MMKYCVKRQDDHGNVFKTPMWFTTLAEAVEVKEILEKYAHKQMYWIEDEQGWQITVQKRHIK